MFLRLINFVLGSIRIEITGDYIERFMNICAMNNIDFWNVRRTGEGKMHATVRINGFKRLRRYARRALCRVHIIKKYGLPFMTKRIKKRYGLIAGTIGCIIFMWMLCGRIWTIEINGCSRIAPAQVMDELNKCGFYIGVKSAEVDPDYISQCVVTNCEDILWITVNIMGSHGQIYVVEREKAPEMLDRDKPCNIIAAKDGIIESMQITSGINVAKEGTTVLKGETLVSGKYTSELTGTTYMHSTGRVLARTWYNLKAVLPFSDGEKLYTGNKSEKYSLILGNKRINFFLSSEGPYEQCSRRITKKSLFAGEGIKLPIALVTEELLEYEFCENPGYEEYVEEILSINLQNNLRELIGEDGEIISSDFSFVRSDGCYIGTFSAECRENIAMEAELVPESSDGVQVP